MPQREDEVKDGQVSNSPTKIVTLWQKFHFSGRVIMCSVLFGMGLILIGGLIFAINEDDESKKMEKDEISGELPTKAPSNYVGPVVMGIGGFIVVVGVIMCLFETQVCRKKTADSKPLISDKNEDVEVKVSDSTPVPSSSHYHKNHKHKSRKASSSPRKSKGKHAKSSSHDQKQSSSKSPPISIEKSKNFMTSSEENFLTPPNTLNEHAALGHSNSREAEIQTSSSLMKSFTSSGTWNQSTEFLTPTASYKENSVSVDNSVELDEKQDQENFKTNEISAMEYTRPEYMTPLTAEEERIQKMLTQVKNEQMKINLEQSEGTATNLSSESGNDASMTNTESEVSKSVENIKISMSDQPLDIKFDNSAVKETAKNDALGESKNVNEENTFSDNFSNVSNVSAEDFISDKNEVESESSDVRAHPHKSEEEEEEEEEGTIKSVPNLHDYENGKPNSFLPSDAPLSHINEDKNSIVSDLEPSKEMHNDDNLQVDLESSVSSEETLVSRDSSMEKPNNNDAQNVLPKAEENFNDNLKTCNVSESPKVDQSSSDHRSSMTDTLHTEKVGASDLTDKEFDLKEIKNSEEKSS